MAVRPAYRLQAPTDRLFGHAVRILDDAGARYGREFYWTFGGGTVMALRHNHRFSKDVDIFVPDPQYLGYLSPRLSDVAAESDPDYDEAAEYLKLRYPEGEVDFVAGGLLTDAGFEEATVDGRWVRLETDLEIVAKKLYFRGNRLKARDLFDLSLVLERIPGSAAALRHWASRHCRVMIALLEQHARPLSVGFAAIDARSYQPDYQAASERVLDFLRAVCGTPGDLST